MPRTRRLREKNVSHSRVRVNSRHKPINLRIRLGPLYPYEIATDQDADIDFIREHLTPKILQAVHRVIQGDEVLGFDQHEYGIDVWTD